jgi:hypothetical protein
MGILEDLKQQTDLKKIHDTAEKREELLRQKDYETLVLPKMQRLYYYLKEIVDHLKYVDFKTQVKDYSERYPQFETLVQQDYKISTDGRGGIGNINQLKEIDISFFLKAEGEFSYYIENKSKIEEEVEFLHACNVPHHLLSHRRGKETIIGTFKVKRHIPVLFNIAVDYDNANIIITAYNHEGLSSLQKTYHPYQINDMFLEKLARYILRKDFDFFQLEISDEQKNSLTEQVQGNFKLTDKIKNLIGVNT